MKMLSPEELLALRQEISEFGISNDRADALIKLLDAIVISFIDQRLGLDPVHLSLSARANYAFSADDSCERVQSSDRFDEVTAKSNGATSTNSAERLLAP